MSDVEDKPVSEEEVSEVEDEVEEESDEEEDAGPQMSKRKKRKFAYSAKLRQLLSDYKNILIVNVDNVGSNQMQKVRMALRELKAIVLMGKNTIIRKIIRESNDEKLQNLLPLVRGNIGFVFTNGDLSEVRENILSNKVPAAARSGAIAPVDVYIPPGPTGLDPGQTSFFQALNINTKIMKGSIEIMTTVHLIRKDEKVTSSAVSLLSKLGVKPFFYGMKVCSVYENGSTYAASILDLSEADMLNKFFNGIRYVAAMSLALEFPTAAMVPHVMINSFKALLAISIMTDYTFEEAKIFKDALKKAE